MYRRLTRRLAGAGLMALTALAGSALPVSGAAADTAPAAVPAIVADLAAYRTQYGLSPCTAADGCLTQVSQTGTSALPGAAAGWDTSVTESADAISAICPNCHLLVVEAASTAITDLGAAENEAAALGAKFIDNDWYTTGESASETSWDTSYFTHPGVAITAPAGDGGYGTSYPAASPDVIAVGGTTLTADASSPRGYDEAAWASSGSGCSAYEPKPSWQTDADCTTRTMNDLSADAGTPVAYYDTPTEGGWGQASGTGISAAIIAAAYADAGTPGSSDNPAHYPYQHPGGSYTTPGNAYTSPTGLNNITAGNDGTCSVTYLCTAGTGYNAPTGLGTPNTALSLTTGGETGPVQVHTAPSICLNGENVANSVPKPPVGPVVASAPADLNNCNGSQSQTWNLLPDGTLADTIVVPVTSEITTGPGPGPVDNESLPACLDTEGATTSGSAVDVQTGCHHNFNNAPPQSEEWTLTSSGELMNPASGLCLDDPAFKTASGTQLDLYTCNGGTNQQWTAPYDRPTVAGAVKSKITTPSLCLDDNGDSSTNGNKIDVWTCNGSAAQNWRIASDGTIQINGGCATPNGNGTVNATAIVYEPCNGNTSQQWTERSDGSLLNTRSGLCLADPNAATANGTAVQLSPCNNQVQQTWTLP